MLFPNMKSVNKVILVGFVGKDPEIKYTASGIPVGTSSLATNGRFKDKSGKFQDRTEWHNIVVWRKLADRLCIQRLCNFQQIMAKLATFWFNSGSATLWLESIRSSARTRPCYTNHRGSFRRLVPASNWDTARTLEARIAERLHAFEEDDDILMAMARECCYSGNTGSANQSMSFGRLRVE
jgi:Single-strand binding protein family